MDAYVENDRLGAVVAPRTVRIERLLPGPVDRVWSYIVNSEKRKKWLAEGPMADHVGGDVVLTFHNGEISDETVPDKYKQYEKHVNRCSILRYEPPHLLSMTWPQGEGEPSEVTFELAASGTDTLLTITHSRLAHRDAMISVSGGWHSHLAALIDVLNGRKVDGFWKKLAEVEAQYRQTIVD